MHWDLKEGVVIEVASVLNANASTAISEPDPGQSLSSIAAAPGSPGVHTLESYNL